MAWPMGTSPAELYGRLSLRAWNPLADSTSKGEIRPQGSIPMTRRHFGAAPSGAWLVASSPESLTQQSFTALA
jgi:hypothetical protein